MTLVMDQQRCEDLLRRKKMKTFFYPLFLDFRNRIYFLEGSQASLTCPS